MILQYKLYNGLLDEIELNKKLICTLNAHCYNLANTDLFYRTALLSCDVLIPDGISIVWAIRWLTGKKVKKIAGADLFFYELGRLQKSGGRCFFLGSSENTLNRIAEKMAKEYPNVSIKTYSPPFKAEFTTEDNAIMLNQINEFYPDVLMVGMTAPKQEKWSFQHYEQLNVGHICCIGAVFDFYAGTVKRSPKWMIKIGLEWFYRLIMEPKRMWRRYLLGNLIFIGSILRAKRIR